MIHKHMFPFDWFQFSMLYFVKFAAGDRQRFVLDFQGFWMKPKGLSTKPFGPFTFQVFLWNDGEIHIYWDTRPEIPYSGCFLQTEQILCL